VTLVYGLSNTTVVMTLGVLKGNSLLQVFSIAIFHIFGTSHGPSAFVELLVKFACQI